MKTKTTPIIKKLIILPLVILTLFFSCQDEETDVVNAGPEDTIGLNSVTANLMARTASNDGSNDNIIDYANCLEIVLPVTVTANGVTITIENFTDYEALEALLDAFTNDEDEVEITFPITVVLNDYSELVINNQEELEAQIENCNGENEDDDDIECIDFEYPISFSTYNPNFQFLDTVFIEDDEALYNFISNLDNSVIVTLNFPVTLITSNHESIVVNNNAELNNALIQYDGLCDEDDDYDYNDDDTCTEASIELALNECLWNIAVYNQSNVFGDYYIQFNDDYTFEVFINNDLQYEGQWGITQSASGIFFMEIATPWQDLNGLWEFVSCDDSGEFELINNNTNMVLAQDCEVTTGPLGCLEANTIVMCDENNDGFETFNLYEGLSDVNGCTINNAVAISYHMTLVDAEGNLNAITNVTSFTNTANPQVVYVRVEVVNNPSQYEILEIELILEDCSIPCEESDVETYLQTCVWNTVNLDGSDNLVGFDLDFNANNDLAITNTATNDTYSGFWSVSTTASGSVVLELANINGPNIQAISGYWDIIECEADRLQFTNDNNAIFVIEQDCN